MFGIVSQSVAYLMELIAQKTRFRRVRKELIQVIPDYLAQRTTAEIDLRFGLRLGDLVTTGILFVVRYLREKHPRKPRLQASNVNRPEIQKG